MSNHQKQKKRATEPGLSFAAAATQSNCKMGFMIQRADLSGMLKYRDRLIEVLKSVYAILLLQLKEEKM